MTSCIRIRIASTTLSMSGSTLVVAINALMKRTKLADVSASIRQDVLLLAGSEDHYVPMKQWRRQIRMLKNARSITARLFTPSESAQNHCQVGNYGLALRTIVNWLDEMPGRN